MLFQIPQRSHSCTASLKVGARSDAPEPASLGTRGAPARIARSASAASSGVCAGVGLGPSAARQTTAPRGVLRPESLTCAGPMTR
jgi:hypothetical protein